MRRKLAAGNWKMNGSLKDLEMIANLGKNFQNATCDIVICPPAVLVAPAVQISNKTNIDIGAQDCHPETTGAFTGDTAASMIADAGARYVIVGHSERRQAYNETDALTAAKATAAQSAGLHAVVCIGESLQERESGTALEVIEAQLKASIPDAADCERLVIAYEPIWAIGTGKIPTMEQIAEVHHLMRRLLHDRFGASANEIRLLYGGSVKPDNAAGIFALSDVDGALVGGASLSPQDFSPIISALQTAP